MTVLKKKNHDMDTKTDVVISDSFNVASSSSNTSSNQSSTDIIETSKKSLSYIFKLAVTKKKLETVEKKIEKLTIESITLENNIQDKHHMLGLFLEQKNNLDLDYKHFLATFDEGLRFNGVSDRGIVLDGKKRQKYLQKHETMVKKSLVQLQKPAKMEQEVRDTSLEQALQQEVQKHSQFLDELYEPYRNAQIKKAVLDQKIKEIHVLEKELATLDKKFTDNQNNLDAADIKLNDIQVEWLLKSYESADPGVSLNDFIAPPHIEVQLKRLIDVYNNISESKKFWVSLPKGIAIFGWPETGKTLLARVFASAIGRKMYDIKPHDLFAENVTDPNQMLSAIFYSIIDHVQKNKEPCIIFLDQIEKIISSLWEYSPASEKMIANTLLKNIINIQKSGLDIIIMESIAERNNIDERFTKYHIFDNQFFLELPDADLRRRLFTFFIDHAEKRAKMKLFDHNMVDQLVKNTEDFSVEHIKQLISVCVKEYSSRFIQNKQTFSIDKKFIWKKIDTLKTSPSITKDTSKDILDALERRQLLNSLVNKYTMQHLIFGELDAEKKWKLLEYMFRYTKDTTASEIQQLFELCNKAYKKNISNYHEKFFIKADFVLEKIQELKSEDRQKGKGSLYLSNK